MAWWIKCLLYKSEGLSLNIQNTYEKLGGGGGVADACSPSARETETGGSGPSWQASGSMKSPVSKSNAE